MEYLLNSVTKRELPGQAVNASGQGAPQTFAVPAQCGIHLRPFLLLVEASAEGTLMVKQAVAVSHNAETCQRQAPVVEMSKRIEAKGSVVLASDYVGCPWCGGETIFSCSCNTLNCSGASRTHGDHRDRFCANCRAWKCMGGSFMKNLTGFAHVTERSRGDVKLPRELANSERSPITITEQRALVIRTELVPRR